MQYNPNRRLNLREIIFMPYCPECKDEFREKFTMCHNCFVPLVEKLPKTDCEDENNMDDYAEYSDILSYKEYLEFKKQQAADTPVLLCSANSHMEVIMLETLLKSNDIPVLVQWRNGGDALMVYMAMSSSGADLYVPSKLFDKAKEVLSTVQDSTTDTTDSEEKVFSEYAKRKGSQRSSNAQVMIIAFVVLTLIYGIAFYFTGYFSWNALPELPSSIPGIPSIPPGFDFFNW